MIFLIFNSAYNESSVLDDVKKIFKSQEAQVQDEFSQWNSENRLGLKLNSVIQKGRLTNLIAEKSPSPMISQVYNRSGRLIATNTSLNISDLDWNTKGNRIQISKKLYEWIPKQTGITGTLSKWGQTTYVYNYKLDDMNVVTQIPVEIYRIKMFDSIKTLLVIVIFFCILIVLFAIIINNVFIQSLLKLTHVTTYLPSKLKNGDIVTWPKSSISEIGSLVSNFQEMSDNLAGMIGQLQTVNQQLYDQTIKLKESESQLYQNAFYDVLTGLPNRFNFLNYLKKLIDGMEEEKTVAVMFIDIDRFKHINDTLGHTAGDILLKTIANRFKNAVEGTSSKGFFVARLGGDEFVVVLNNVSDDEIENAAVLLIESLSEPIELFDYNLHIKASIGISVYPSDGKDPDEIVKNADTSMYVAKKSGGNSFKYYSCIFNKELTEKMDIELDIYKALERNEFILYYQPKVDTLTGRIIAAEALIRWRHPKYGMVRPDQFIYIAEETGLIAEIGEWVLNETSRYIKYLHDLGYPEIRISFNWSPVQFNSQNIVALVENALKNTGLEARYLEVEITESFLIKNIDAVSNQLSKLKEIGVNISIDDFGKEYSSLGLLRSIPINCIKIDKSFMNDIPGDDGNCSIVRAIVNVAHDLGFHVTAEGVETRGQADFLKSLACDEMQGYLISYPLPEEDFEKLLSRTKENNFQLDVLEEIV